MSGEDKGKMPATPSGATAPAGISFASEGSGQRQPIRRGVSAATTSSTNRAAMRRSVSAVSRSSTTKISPRPPSVQIKRMRGESFQNSPRMMEQIAEAVNTPAPNAPVSTEAHPNTLRLYPPPSVAPARIRSISNPARMSVPMNHLATASPPPPQNIQAAPAVGSSTIAPGSPDPVGRTSEDAPSVARTGSVRRRALSLVPSLRSLSRKNDDRSSLSSAAKSARLDPEEMYGQHLVDLLDVVDPEVGTITSLANVQNSLFVPNLGRFSRAPVIKLSPRTTQVVDRYSAMIDAEKAEQQSKPLGRPPTVQEDVEKEEAEADGLPQYHPMEKPPVVHDIAQPTQEGHWAVMPDDIDWTEWTQDEKDEIDDYVRHLLHSKKEKARRRWRGFLKFASRPFGLFITIYALLLTFWGTAWVLFLIGWINVGEKKKYWVNICDQILVALFALVGIGMFPFRLVDTYHMAFIAKYHLKSLRLRKERGMPALDDDNDLPPPVTIQDAEGGLAIKQDDPDQVLTLEEEEKFLYHQTKFCHSHTFYRPHETATHFAFPLKLLVTIVTMLDFHSIFQCCLGGVTWGISYHDRPGALTAVILACSLSCNIGSGLLITYGDHKIRKKEIVERQLRQALTEEAIERKAMAERIQSRLAHEQEEKTATEGLQSLKNLNDASVDHFDSSEKSTQGA